MRYQVNNACCTLSYPPLYYSCSTVTPHLRALIYLSMLSSLLSPVVMVLQCSDAWSPGSSTLSTVAKIKLHLSHLMIYSKECNIRDLCLAGLEIDRNYNYYNPL